MSIPNTVTSIGTAAFEGCTAMNSVTIGSNVASIGNNAFKNCNALISVTIPNNVITIGESAFESCDKLRLVNIGSGVTTIGKDAFRSSGLIDTINFYGLLKPTSVGSNWIKDTANTIKGHAYAASNFPTPNNKFETLTMGTTIP